MLTAERKRQLLLILESEGKILSTEAAKRMGVSEDTVRRDLRELDKTGLLQRVHGGALPRSRTSIQFAEREKESAEVKQRIGLAAATLLQSGEVVLLDGGTTCVEVARRIPADCHLTVITHSLSTAQALSEHPAVECRVVGGRLFKPARVTVGSEAVDAYRMIRPDTCVLGVSAVHLEAGVTLIDAEEAEVKRAMVEYAARVVIVAASEKLGTVSPFSLMPTGRVTHLITDSGASLDFLQGLKQIGIEIVIV